jgi:hypothetical protein
MSSTYRLNVASHAEISGVSGAPPVSNTVDRSPLSKLAGEYMTLRSIVGSALMMCALLALPMFPAGIAFARRDCRQRIHREEQRLDGAIRRHGEHSRQAEKERHKLHELREECRDRR